MEQDAAVAEGGPLDGHVLGIAGADHFEVTMLDDTHHRYERTVRRRTGTVIYKHTGRDS